MIVQDRISACRGMDTNEIGAQMSDLDQDEVTNALVQLIGERTNKARLPQPYTVGFTMYGDADVSEWVLRHGPDGVVVDEGESDAVDVDTRWEHWEDAVRLVNGDVPALSLLYARRITIGDEPTTSNEPAWLRAADFAPGSTALETGRVLTHLLDAYESSERNLAAYTDRVGLAAIAHARAIVVGWALLESGCGEDMKGMYWQVACGDDLAIATVMISESAAAPESTALRAGTAGIALRYATADAMVAEATGARTFQDLLVNGLVRVEGSDEDRGRFAKSLMSFARLHGI